MVLLGLIAFGVHSATRHLWADHHLRAAQEAEAKGDVKNAWAHLQKCLEVRPASPQVHLLLARTARRGDSYDEAATHLRECARRGGAAEIVELERVLARVQRGDCKGVEEFLWASVEKGHPDRVPILEALASGYLRTFRLTLALRCLDLWLEGQPDNVRALFWKGEALDRMREFSQALACYRRVVELTPDDDAARLRLADSLVQSAHAQEALGHYAVLRENNPDNRQVLLGLARCRVALKERDEARRLLDLLPARPPAGPEVLTLRGRLELEAGRPDEAEGWLRRAVEQRPHDREAVYTLAQCLLQRGKKQEGEEWLARFHRIARDQGRLARLTSEVIAAPHDPSPRCQAGQIFLDAGNDKEGLRWLLSALQEDPGHRPSHEALATYYRRAGKPDLAATHEQWLKMYP